MNSEAADRRTALAAPRPIARPGGGSTRAVTLSHHDNHKNGDNTRARRRSRDQRDSDETSLSD